MSAKNTAKKAKKKAAKKTAAKKSTKTAAAKTKVKSTRVWDAKEARKNIPRTPEGAVNADRKLLGQKFTVTRLRSERESIVLATIGDIALVEYQLKDKPSINFVRTADLKAGKGGHRNILYSKLPRSWVEAVVNAKTAGKMNGKLPELKDKPVKKAAEKKTPAKKAAKKTQAKKATDKTGKGKKVIRKASGKGKSSSTLPA